MSNKTKPFRPADVNRGDRLVLARYPLVGLRFKFMGLDGAVVASWEEPPETGAADVIVRQRDVLIPVGEAS
jgi:hypothetical protein